MLLITFSKVSDKFYEEANIPDKYEFVIDLYNQVDHSKIKIQVYKRNDFPELTLWIKNARKNYLDFLAQLSISKISKNKSIRDFKLYNFPIYWLTSISEKHPRNHWLYSFFLFQEFLKSNYYIDKELVIYLNNQTSELKKNILEINLENEHKRNISFIILEKRNTLRILLGILKSQILSFHFKLESSNSEKQFEKAQIQVISQKCNRVFYTQFKNADFFKDYQIAFKPLNYFSLQQETYNHISSDFSNFLPGTKKKIEIFLKSFLLFLRITVLLKKIKFNKIKFPSTILKDEFYDVLKNAQLYFSIYFTYIYFFKGIKKRTIFFLEDEFYNHGRIICKAFNDAQNKNVKLFGMQHGMFSESHTVYSILNEEIIDIHKGDAIPLPEKFIVWGDFFKNLFHKKNQLNTNFTEVLGCPHYIHLKSHINTLKKDNKNVNYILWCTTGVEQFLFELPFVLKLLEFYSLPIVIRYHPLGHISKEFIEKKLHGVTYTFDSEKEIYNSIINSYFVITSAHSTVVLDCLVCEKKVYRIIFDRSDEEFTEPSEFIINVKKMEDLESTHNNIFLKDYTNKYLYLKEDRWNSFLNRNLKEC
ncbi:MAG: hypothetical protein ACK4IK_05080 [Bacteroidia bacterium]